MDKSLNGRSTFHIPTHTRTTIAKSVRSLSTWLIDQNKVLVVPSPPRKDYSTEGTHTQTSRCLGTLLQLKWPNNIISFGFYGSFELRQLWQDMYNECWAQSREGLLWHSLDNNVDAETKPMCLVCTPYFEGGDCPSHHRQIKDAQVSNIIVRM